ncbi:putative iron-regulated membrane protein [Pseudoxanthomonas japonensis]|uniref:PepSY-associated TM helix domain-containing protein n=1 Tax=Pseudoxanthomonas japonensis TaxID=69284 RepID=UPI0028576D02|nr:PepSY-associated TM helix domain-containing protein [Pseudoxanthomonas japonensis]MDR7068089.1 putative iron-regulated membrane protein [Pseudoxanthomonas japonensis]
MAEYPAKPGLLDAPSLTSTSRFYRLSLWLHRWCSLVATVPFLILCLTGTVLVFHEEIDAAMGVMPDAPGLSAAQRPLSESVDAILDANPSDKVIYLGLDSEHHPGLLLLNTVPEGDSNFDRARLHFTDLATAERIEAEAGEGMSLTGFLLELHAQWFLGPLGELLGALIALMVLVSLLSGLVVYWPHVKKVTFGLLRRGKGPRLRQLDLHNTIGAIVLGWAFAVSLTGFLLGFGTLATGLWSQQQLALVQSMYAGSAVDPRRPPIDADVALRSALSAAPKGWQVSSILWPATVYSTPRHYTVLVGGSGLDERLVRVVLVDASTGEVAGTAELPWYLKAITLSEPLHFGDYGGMPLKILWTVCTWLTLFITANGAWLWWDRRRKRKAHRSAKEIAP